MPRRNSNAPQPAASSSASGGSRGPRPPKSANYITPASPSPDSSSDNASDNSDLFSWSAMEPPSPAPRASLSSSRKRKLLEQFLLPDGHSGASAGGTTVSLAEMRSMGLVGPPRPSVAAANPPPTSRATSSFAASFSFYQSHAFGHTSCSAGGSTESLCSSTADSACGHQTELPDDGALSTPNPSHGVNAAENTNSDVMEISCVRGTGRESASPGTGNTKV